MQIPTNFSAAQAASIASVVSNRDKNTAQAAAVPDTSLVQAQLEKSESANPDRDAQGQGDGLGHHARKQHDENEIASLEGVPESESKSSPSDDCPPELDLVC